MAAKYNDERALLEEALKASQEGKIVEIESLSSPEEEKQEPEEEDEKEEEKEETEEPRKPNRTIPRGSINIPR